MKFKGLAAAAICATSSLCAPAVVVTPSLTSVSGVTTIDMISRLMVGSIRNARPVNSAAAQPALVTGNAEPLLTFKNSLSGYSESFMSLAPAGSYNGFWKTAYGVSAVADSFNKLGDTISPVNFNAVAALSETQNNSPETGYSLMLLTGLAVMVAIALRRSSGQGS